ncbi:MAG: efflux RND transporter periplasmic adaptor subunit [Gammaproteobacteria bacterium]|nr:MAG: efflux RND transporter periplasmic adaptor subunit [Gammaproteobacteria bacterium]
MKKRPLIYVISLILGLYLIGHIFFPTRTNPQGTVSVAVSPVEQKDVTVTLQTIGTVQAYSSVEIKSMVTGPLVNTGFKEGDVVEQNQVLFQIDQRPFVASLNQAEANLARDQATLNNVRLQVKRNTPLLGKGYIAKQDYDTLVANEESAEATVKADQAAVENAQLQLSYTTIRAPMVAKTGNIMLKPGSVIKANDTNELVTLNQINPIYVAFSVPQNRLLGIQQNMQKGPVAVKALVNGQEIEQGTLTFVDNAVDAATGSIQLKATYPNKQRLLWPGEYVTVDLPAEQISHALLIPSSALLTGQKGFYVYVIDKDNVAHMRDVTPGPVLDNMTVIEKGLQASEQVAASGQLRLKEGIVVQATS